MDRSRRLSPGVFQRLNVVAMTDVQPLVLDIIAALENEFSIDTRRFYVTGQSAGGFGTYAFITRNPGMFAAAVPVSNSRDMFAALKKAGGNPKYTEYKGVKHNSWDKTYATEELWEWLFAQKKPDK